jgi:hypothetical protein
MLTVVVFTIRLSFPSGGVSVVVVVVLLAAVVKDPFAPSAWTPGASLLVFVLVFLLAVDVTALFLLG